METFINYKCTECPNEYDEKFKNEIAIKDIPDTKLCEECYGLMVIKVIKK